jgi:hypothetical protein
VERTLLEAAIRAGDLDLARALVSERLSVRERSTYAWSKRAFLLAAAGDPVGAASAAARERELAAQIQAAADEEDKERSERAVVLPVPAVPATRLTDRRLPAPYHSRSASPGLCGRSRGRCGPVIRQPA